MPRVKVVHETPSGLNDRIKVGDKVMTNNQAYREAKKGNIPGYHGVNRNGKKFIRSNPDRSAKNNLER